MPRGKKVTITGKNKKWNGTNGNDTVTVKGTKYITVNAKNGDDNIYIRKGNWHEINAGPGNDTITVYKGNNHTIDVGSGKKDKVIIKGGNNHTIGDWSTYSGTGGAVTIEIYKGKKHAINAGYINRNVTVKVKGGSTSNIYTWGGNDTIEVSGKAVVNNWSEPYAIGHSEPKWGINTGAGNDKVTLNSTKSNGVIIKAGSGDDVITVKKGNNHQIYTGDGNDRVIISGGKGHTLYLEKSMYGNGKNDVTLTNTQATINTEWYVDDNITINWKKNGLNDYAVKTSTLVTSGGVDSLNVTGINSSEFTFSENNGTLVMSAESGSISIEKYVNNFQNGITFADGTLSLDQIHEKVYGW